MWSAEDRSSDPRIWLVTLFFFSCIIIGGIFLVMYIALPETEETSHYPFVGMLLVAIPWLFWFLVFLYRILWKQQELDAACSLPLTNASAVVPTCETDGAMVDIVEEPSEDSKQGNRKVRFGGSTVMEGDILEDDQEGDQEVKGDNSSTATTSEGSSLPKRECEVPLAFAMST